MGTTRVDIDIELKRKITRKKNLEVKLLYIFFNIIDCYIINRIYC